MFFLKLNNSNIIFYTCLNTLKKDIHNRAHGKLVKRVKYYCDVLLRE